MNLLLALTIFTGMDLYFLKDSNDLLVRILPKVQTEQITLYYSFSGTDWNSKVLEKRGQFFDAVITPPANLMIVGLYATYNGKTDNNEGALYLYEVKNYPRMIMPFSISVLDVILEQVRKKIKMTGRFYDEGVTLLYYVDNMVKFLPVVENTPNEIKRDMLKIDVQKLKEQID